MSRKILIILMIVLCIASPLFAVDNTQTNSGLDNYIENFTKAAQTIAILISSVFIIFGGFKIWSAGGLNKENIGYLVSIVAGIIIVALALTLPSWVQGLQNGA